jgi:hypothetical protein
MKKITIKPKYKWCRAEVNDHHAEFNYHTSRANARMWARSAGGKAVRIVSITYTVEN